MEPDLTLASHKVHNSTMRINLKVLAALAIMAPFSVAQTPPELTTLYSFTGGAGGAAPYGGLAVSKSGTVYGTTENGGSPADGTVFELTEASGVWTQAVIHNFMGYPNDGENPYGNLVLGKSGTLYGTTSGGGFTGSGSVFELIPSTTAGGAWTERAIYAFAGKSSGMDGANPRGGVTIGAGGTLYGTTSRGGLGNGTVFQLTPPTKAGKAWKETVLYRFTNLDGDGAFPQAGLVIDKDGNLYGTTENGGSGCTCGVVFKLAPPASTGGAWTESILYSFAGASDGAYPEAGLIFGSNGALYGTTYQGGPAGLGTVFELAPPASSSEAWTLTTLYSFQGGTDGAYPFAGLVFGSTGALYGTTINGGTSGNGTVFELAPPSSAGGLWSESILYNFAGGSDGSIPYAGVVFGPGGALFGATTAGGSAGSGTVFQLTL
jgi:uncharacterized repeat protein (TIGR03803 family)